MVLYVVLVLSMLAWLVEPNIFDTLSSASACVPADTPIWAILIRYLALPMSCVVSGGIGCSIWPLLWWFTIMNVWLL